MTIHFEQNGSWIPLASQQYEKVDKTIIEYAGRDWIQLAMTEKESPYRTHQVVINLFLQFINEDQACTDKGFPQSVVDLFKKNNLSLWRIPSLGEQPDPKTLAIPLVVTPNFQFKFKWNVMRFTINGCPGLCLSVQKKVNSSLGGSLAFLKVNKNPKDDTWRKSVTGSNKKVEQAIGDCIKAPCPHNEGASFLNRLVSSRDPEFVIEEIPQVEPEENERDLYSTLT